MYDDKEFDNALEALVELDNLKADFIASAPIAFRGVSLNAKDKEMYHALLAEAFDDAFIAFRRVGSEVVQTTVRAEMLASFIEHGRRE